MVQIFFYDYIQLHYPFQEAVGLDSGAASPKSSVSSSSVDAHLVNLRLQPIPEEVRALIPSRMNASCDDLSLAGTTR